MGCDYYEFEKTSIHFSDLNEETSCLCTFPYNEEIFKQLDPHIVRSLAMLGAAIVLVHQAEFNDDYMFLPEQLPEWIVNEIKKYVPN